jgi:hypothetical protein
MVVTYISILALDTVGTHRRYDHNNFHTEKKIGEKTGFGSNPCIQEKELIVYTYNRLIHNNTR